MIDTSPHHLFPSSEQVAMSRKIKQPLKGLHGKPYTIRKRQTQDPKRLLKLGEILEYTCCHHFAIRTITDAQETRQSETRLLVPQFIASLHIITSPKLLWAVSTTQWEAYTKNVQKRPNQLQPIMNACKAQLPVGKGKRLGNRNFAGSAFHPIKGGPR